LPKVLILYDSGSGNTEKMAYGVAEGAKNVEGISVKVLKVDNAGLNDLEEADGIIVGSPTYYGQMSGKLKSFFDESVKIHGRLAGKVGAAFTSSGGTASGAETTLLSILEALLIHGMIVEGRADDKHYGAAAVQTPNEEELNLCRELGERVARLVIKLTT